MKKKNPRRNINFIILIALALILLGVLIFYFVKGNSDIITYDILKQWLTDKKIGDHDIVRSQLDFGAGNNTYEIRGLIYLSNGQIKRFSTEVIKQWIGDAELDWFKGLSNSSITHYDRTFTPMWLEILRIFLPIILFIGVFFFISRMLSKAGGMSFGPSKGSIDQSHSDVKFTDIAGINEEKQELVEIVDYLKNPEKYSQMGARTPKGVLLEGPPGTGKTLLAKAVAGEANVPFFSAPGSGFEEVYVGLGSKRIRDLFNNAKKNAPCIIFIDEIDAVGKKRSSSLNSGAGEQTLNQLLVEMDGFSTDAKVIVMAATNRVDVLDPALLRPGRFDRQIQLSLPDIKEREAILRLHARNKNVSSKVSFERIASRTPGFSGAQLENVLNEAAIRIVRLRKKVIELDDIDEAIDRVIGGPAKTSRIITENDKQIVSYHEAGHAVVGLKLEHASKVQKVTIIPRGQAGGYTIVTPKEETLYDSKTILLSKIAGLLGGRVAEELIFGKDKITTGAYDDLEKATAYARKMVTIFGMSSLGLRQFENPREDYQGVNQRKFSESVAKNIDDEINIILNNAYDEATKIVNRHKELLELIAESLRILETITAEQIEYIEKHHTLPDEAILAKKRQQELKEKELRGDIIEAKPKQQNDNLTLSDIDKSDINNNLE